MRGSREEFSGTTIKETWTNLRGVGAREGGGDG